MVWLKFSNFFFWTVKCGKDQTFDNVLVDTGSAILWVGGEEPYVQGSNTEEYVSHYDYAFASNLLFNNAPIVSIKLSV